RAGRELALMVENRHHATSLARVSASATRNSPDIRRGSSRSRVRARVRDSWMFARIFARIGATLSLKASATACVGRMSGYFAMIDQLVRGILVPVEVLSV